MIDEERRQEIYSIAFQFMIENDISTIPVSPSAVCEKLGIGLAKLTDIIQETGLSKNDIFAIWGNEDGVLNSCGEICRIAYNDTVSKQRQSFTIVEEVSHKLLGHYKDPEFNMFIQDYNYKTYYRYEEEARICAGLILCPPQYYYECKGTMRKEFFQTAYNVSEPCANARMHILWKYESEIKKCELYNSLPKIGLDLQYVKNLFI